MKSVSVGLVGEGILSSKSPLLHQSEAESQNLNLSYELYDFLILKKTEKDLDTFLKTIKLLGYSGLNITHPFKQAVIPFLDELSEDAQTINAVNTVVFKDHKKIGYNTDYLGFQNAFKAELNDVNLTKVIQLGAGGAGSAVATAMLRLGTKQLMIHDKDMHRAQSLTAMLNEKFGAGKASAIEDAQFEILTANGLINTTPVGMSTHPGMPTTPNTLRSELWVADIVYFPIETELLKNARAIGCRTMGGGKMVVYQAAKAFELFTGLTANTERMLLTFKSSY
ncbi:shikimate dehydrogenase [Gammaproteobacteria bacterium]|nr:shikimate dehydrogenase [Gammaproteobacteria bacterium]